MIIYTPFWETLKKSDESWYTLKKNHHISDSTLSKLRNNKRVSLQTINDLCRILDCKIEDIATYVPSDEDQPL